jgi:pimeloyl-ACP methyl ester carboxylesterase
MLLERWPEGSRSCTGAHPDRHFRPRRLSRGGGTQGAFGEARSDTGLLWPEPFLRSPHTSPLAAQRRPPDRTGKRYGEAPGRRRLYAAAAHPRGGDLDRLAEIACPTLIIASADDRVRGVVEAEELRAGIRHSELVLIDGAGHMAPLEAPDQLARVIESWIDRVI